MSTYHYAANNPVMFNDPMGDQTGGYDEVQPIFHGGYKRISALSGNNWSNELEQSRSGNGFYADFWNAVLDYTDRGGTGGLRVSQRDGVWGFWGAPTTKHYASENEKDLHTVEQTSKWHSGKNANQGGADPNGIWGKMFIISNVAADADLSDGHECIRLESQSGNATTMSLWGNQGNQEFWINKEKDFGYGAFSKSLVITNAQYNLINNFNSVPSNINWTYFYTCAGYSAAIWNYVTGDHLSAGDNFGTTTPRALAGSIQTHPTGAITPGSSIKSF